MVPSMCKSFIEQCFLWWCLIFGGWYLLPINKGIVLDIFFKYHDLTATLLEMMVLIGNPK